MNIERKILWIMTCALSLGGCEEATSVKVNGQEVGTSLSRPPEPAVEELADDTAAVTASNTNTDTSTDTDTDADTDTDTDANTDTQTETGTGTDTSTSGTPPATATESATDTAAGPTDASVLVNGGATATKDLAATLTLAATGATEMYVTTTSGCAEGGTWEAYATSKALSLPQPNATNTVFVKFRNASAESACVEDTIVHDDQAPAAPTLAGTTPASPSKLATGVVVALTTAADVTGFELFLDSTCTSPVGSGSALELSGEATIDVATNTINTLYVRANDDAGNLSTCAQIGAYEHDDIRPTVVSVDSDAVNDTYGPGEQLDLKLRFDSDVVVDDDHPSFALYLTLETGTTDRAAIYQNVNADGDLVFRYTPAHGDVASDLDYVSTTAIILQNGEIRDTAGNLAVLGLPSPGAAGSLASNKALVIDRVAPAAPTLDSTVQAGVGNLRLRWSEGANDVTGYVVVRSASAAPTWTPTHGTAAALGATGTGDDEVVHASSQVLLIDTGVANATTYHYAVYAHDALYNYSTPATGSAAPKQAPVSFAQVEVGADFGCGLESHGKVYCWGSIVNTTSPVAIATTDMGTGSKQFKQIAAGAAFVCGLATDGVVHCWGSDSQGQLGNDAGGDQALPAPIATGAAADKTFVQVVAGAANACALAMSGGVYCWGAEKRAGIDVVGNQPAPVAIDTTNVTAPSLFRALHGRAQGACAVAVDGKTYCWGADEEGEIGNGGGNVLEPKPVEIAAQYFHQITAGETHGCGISTGRSLFCWGENGDSQLGDATTIDTITPGAVTVTAITDAQNSAAFKEVATGTGFTCALAVDGIVHCFGVNTNGRLGANLATTSTVSSPSGTGLARPADNLVYRYVDIDAAADHACAVTTGGKIHCWGSGSSGRLGNGDSTDAVRPVALDDASLTGDTGFLELGKGGSNHGCGISTERKAYCWGANTSGQLGSGSTSGSAVHLPLPVDMSNLGSTNRSFLSVTAGEAHSCGVSGIGDAFCWGSNTSGRLGIGNADTTAVAVRPEPVHTGNAALFTASYSKKFVHVGTGTAHACGLAADANIYCWGSNALGQLGTSSVAGASVEPARVDWSGAVGTPIQLTVGAYHSCALTDRGTAYCWGEDANDKLGDGVGSTNQSTPRLVTGASRFVELTAGVQHTCALDGERNVYCWGDGSKLQLGTTTTADEPNPAAITTGFGTADVKFAHLSAGFEHTCGVTSKGGAYCWGTDGAGRLGIDSAQASLDVPSEDDVSLPAAGTTWPKLEVGCASRTCAITQSGKLYCWGSDAYGALGNWTTTGDQDVPSAVSLLAL